MDNVTMNREMNIYKLLYKLACYLGAKTLNFIFNWSFSQLLKINSQLNFKNYLISRITSQESVRVSYML